MDRYQNWAEKLSDFLFASKDREFVRGEFDCALFACDAFLVQTGIDPGEDFRGKYTTLQGAAKELKKHGGTLRQVTVKKFEGEFKLQRVLVAFAQRGDMAYAKVGKETVLAVVDLSGRFLTLSPHRVGPIVIPIEYISIVWRIE